MMMSLLRINHRASLSKISSFGGISSARNASKLFSSDTRATQLLIIDFLPLMYKYFYGVKHISMSIERDKAVALGVSKFGFPISPEGDPQVSTGNEHFIVAVPCLGSYDK